LTSSDFSKTQFIHHPLIKGSQGQKLSKSAGDALIKGAKRDKNELPHVINLVGAWLGLPEHLGHLNELREASQNTCRQLMSNEFR
jgi:glutamyl/glutaminyl-tRNA synthetase